jgi:peptidoglycan/xylan/chitin deacetylase (PgdA/CDA1 family)
MLSSHRRVRRLNQVISVPFVASVVKSLLRSAGYYRRRLNHANWPGPVVLCYHGVLPDDADRTAIPFAPLHVSARRLAEHCKVIAEYCAPIGLSQFVDQFQGRGERSGTPRPPRRSILTTFDDGYANLLSVATPILERFGVPATLFACTGPIASGEPLWTDRVAAALGDAEVERMKDESDDVRRHVVSGTNPSPFRHDHCRLMNVDEFRRLTANRLWSIGGHTHTHPILARCSPEVQRGEIVGNLDRLEELIGDRPRAFAYPNGRPERDFDETTRRILAESGVNYAFTTQAGFVVDVDRPLDIPRMLMTEGVTGTELLHRLAVSWPR